MKWRIRGARIGSGRFSISRATLEALYDEATVLCFPYSRRILGRFSEEWTEGCMKVSERILRNR